MPKINGKYLNDMESLLPQDLQDELELVRDSYREHKAVQAEFEAKVRAHLQQPDLVFSYRFGKLSISQGEPKAAPKAAAPKINLAQWLEQQR